MQNVFEHLNQVWLNIEGKMKSESFKQKILSCIRAWEDSTLYPNEYLVRLQNTFLGLIQSKVKETPANESKSRIFDRKHLNSSSPFFFSYIYFAYVWSTCMKNGWTIVRAFTVLFCIIFFISWERERKRSGQWRWWKAFGRWCCRKIR